MWDTETHTRTRRYCVFQICMHMHAHMPSEVWSVTVGVRSYHFYSSTRTEHVTWCVVLWISSQVTSVMFWMLYAFFWVTPRHLNFICQCFGTLCLFHLHRRVGMKNDYLYHPMAHPEEIMQLLITCFPYIYRVATHYAKTRSDQLSFTSEHASSFFSSYSS